MRSSLRRSMIGLVIFGAVACAGDPGPEDFHGLWGDDEVQLTLNDMTARFETPCWIADLTMPLVVNGDRFDATGILTWRGGAGMTETQNAAFVGRRNGSRLTLTIGPAELGLGPFHLRRGEVVELSGCPVPP